MLPGFSILLYIEVNQLFRNNSLAVRRENPNFLDHSTESPLGRAYSFDCGQSFPAKTSKWGCCEAVSTCSAPRPTNSSRAPSIDDSCVCLFACLTIRVNFGVFATLFFLIKRGLVEKV